MAKERVPSKTEKSKPVKEGEHNCNECEHLGDVYEGYSSVCMLDGELIGPHPWMYGCGAWEVCRKGS